MPIYEPEKWNKNPFLRESHNCYSYFLNKISKKSINDCRKKLKTNKYKKKYKKVKIYGNEPCNPCKRPHPGLFSKKKLGNKNINCKDITNNVLFDNKNIKLKSKKCPPKYYEGILLVFPNKDYHFIRIDSDGKMSHKNGIQKASRYIKFLDSNNKLKKYKLNKKNFKIFKKLGGKICQSFCIPDLPNKLNYKTEFFKNNDCRKSNNIQKIDKLKNIKDKNLYKYFKHLENPHKYKYKVL